MTTLQEVHARFARDQGLPFTDSLSETSILDSLNEHDFKYRDRVFGPVTTIWGFLSQVLSDDHSCRDAVSRIIAHRAASGLKVCSPNTASFCNARARIPTAVLGHLAKQTAQQLQAGLPDGWKWNGRSVFIADGSHVWMPDTPENQAVYPQPVVQQPGIGFSLARVAVLLSLATGACHDLAIAPYAGKGTGETTLLRRMYDSLCPGDVVLADALFDNYFLACELRQLGVELVARVQAERVGSRTVESRPDGDVILWQRPNKPRGMTGEEYRRYPKTLLMRQVAVDARDKNNRAKRFKVVSSILDASIDAMLAVIAYHRVGNRPGRWEPRARKRRPKPGKRLGQPRRVAKLAHNRTKWYEHAGGLWDNPFGCRRATPRWCGHEPPCAQRSCVGAADAGRRESDPPRGQQRTQGRVAVNRWPLATAAGRVATCLHRLAQRF